MVPGFHGQESEMVLQQLLGIELPLIQAPMAGAQGSALAIAVSNAGGLGSLPCAMLGPDALCAELGRIRAQTDKPYNVNFFCHRPPVPDATREALWRQSLAHYYREFDVDPATIPAGPGRLPFDTAAADLLAEFKPPVVSFHFGLPDRALLARVRSWGAKVISSATTVDEARWLEANGADVIVAQGLEAGGHRGMFLTDDLTTQMGTLALLPQIVRAVRVPVVAAGGIADAAGVRAALALGAAGVQVGTAYLLCPQATPRAVHRAAIAQAVAQGHAHTAVTRLFSGRPARGLMNRLMRELGPLHPAAPPFPWATTALGPLREAAEAAGQPDCSPLWAGQAVALCRAMDAGDLTRHLASGWA